MPRRLSVLFAVVTCAVTLPVSALAQDATAPEAPAADDDKLEDDAEDEAADSEGVDDDVDEAGSEAGEAADAPGDAEPTPETVTAPPPVDDEPPPIARVVPRKDAPPPEAEGMDGVMTGLLTFGAGAGVGLGVSGAFFAFSLINTLTGGLLGLAAAPIGCLSCLWTCFAHPAAVGFLAAWLGDLFGNMRGALAWAMGGAFAGCTLGIVITVVISVVIAVVLVGSVVGSILTGDPNAVTAAINTLGANPIFLGVNLGILLLQNVLVAGGATAGYLLFSEPKKPGDAGGFPGVFSPNHPEAMSGRSGLRLAPREESFAMAY